MRVVPQCFGPEEVDIALRLSRVLPFLGSPGIVSLDTAPAFMAWRLLVPTMRELCTTLGRTPYFASLLRYRRHEARPAHVDSLEHGAQHHPRIVVLCKAPELGGELLIRGELAPLRVGDGVVFDAASDLHEVRGVERGERIAVTVGVLV